MNNKIIVFKFDRCHFEGHPPPSTLVIQIFGFVVIEIMGFDPREARQGNITIEMALSSFFIRVVIWLKISHDDWNWVLINVSSSKFFYVFRWPYQSG
jgi:hypothetical protein